MSAIEKQLVDSSRMIADMVTLYIGNNQGSFDEAVELMNREIYPLSMRASRVLYLVSTNYPSLVQPHISSFIKKLKQTKIDGVKRSLLGMLTETKLHISEDDLGELTEISFNFMLNPKEPIAVRAQCIDLILKIMKTYPELKPELIVVLESIYPESSVGLKNKIRRLLPKLNKDNLKS